MRERVYWMLFGMAFLIVIIVIPSWLVTQLSKPIAPINEAVSAKEIARESTVAVKVGTVQVYKPEVKTKLGLPKEVQKSNKKHVVSSSKVKNDGKPHTITTVLDTSTGEFVSYDRTDPLPFISARNTTHISAYYGIKNANPVVRLQIQQEMLSIKAVTVEAIANADVSSDTTDTFVGIGARISF